MTATVFGIRHHGPGSARSLERALVALAPDAVLIEGPPEADALIELAASEDMEPPVALLTYALVLIPAAWLAISAFKLHALKVRSVRV